MPAKRVESSLLLGSNYPTQLSIAREAGLSRTTVAEILAGKRLERYNKETQRKVFEVAERLNYRPHRSAQAVRRGRSNLIGVFHSSSVVQSSTERAVYLGQAIMRSGFELFLNDGLWYGGNVEHSIGQMLSARVEGIIISGFVQLEKTKREELLGALRSANIPVVAVSSYTLPESSGVPSIKADFTQGFRMLTEHLIREGRRRLVLETITGGGSGRIRYEGFEQGLIACGGHLHEPMEFSSYRNPWKGKGIEGVWIGVEPEGIVARHDPCKIGSEFLEKLLEQDLEADAILASNDYHAFGMLTSCYRRGISVPEAFAVTGADNSYLSRQGPVPITSLEQPTEEMCNLAVESLLHHIKGTATSRHRGAQLPCRLVIRDSSQRSALSTAIPS